MYLRIHVLNVLVSEITSFLLGVLNKLPCSVALVLKGQEKNDIWFYYSYF